MMIKTTTTMTMIPMKKDKDNDDDDDKAVWVGDGADTESLEPPQCYNYLQSDTGGVNITFNITPK